MTASFCQYADWWIDYIHSDLCLRHLTDWCSGVVAVTALKRLVRNLKLTWDHDSELILKHIIWCESLSYTSSCERTLTANTDSANDCLEMRKEEREATRAINSNVGTQFVNPWWPHTPYCFTAALHKNGDLKIAEVPLKGWRLNRRGLSAPAQGTILKPALQLALVSPQAPSQNTVGTWKSQPWNQRLSSQGHGVETRSAPKTNSPE